MTMRIVKRGTWRRRIPALVMYLRFAALAPIMLGCLYLLIFLPAAPAIAVIQATMESISFEVAVPEMNQVRLTGFSLSFESPDMTTNLGFRDATQHAKAARKPACLSGVIVPEPGTRVTYKRFGTEAPIVVFERGDGRPAVTFGSIKGELPAAAKQASWLRLEGKADSDDDKKGCDGTPSSRLPIYGVAELGTELRPAGAGDEKSSGALIEGTLDIFARTIELQALTEKAPRIYPASTTSIALPPGSRIAEYTSAGETRQPWTGFVQTDADKALGVKVTTPAMRLAIIRPGLGTVPEVLSIGLFTQLVNDPTLVAAQLVIVLIYSILEIFGSAVSAYSNKKESDQEPQSSTD